MGVSEVCGRGRAGERASGHERAGVSAWVSILIASSSNTKIQSITHLVSHDRHHIVEHKVTVETVGVDGQGGQGRYGPYQYRPEAG